MFVVLLFLWVLIFPTPVAADPGRITLEPSQTEGTAGLPGIAVKARLTVSSSDLTPSIEERANLGVRSGGGICKLDIDNEPTDNNGYIYGHCGRDSAGQITIFAFSLDNSDESTDVTLTFGAESTPTPAPTSTPIPIQTPSSDSNSTSNPTSTPIPTSLTKQLKPTTKQPLTNSQTGGFGGDGLVEERDDAGGTGLASGQVLGTGTQDVGTTGDKDLLATLIFLTGTVVLIVWTVYAVLVQKGVISGGKKDGSSRGGIAPQPLD